MSSMPAVFFGHGSPTNTLDDNRHTRAWRDFGRACPKPRAVLIVSAHWYVPFSAVTAMAAPRTIHDFYGFPQPLFDFEYPAPGDPELAERISHLLAPTPIRLDQSWGLDHGAWSVLAHVYPDANIPVLQLSIDSSRPASEHYRIGRALAPLRDEGILVAASGNIVHNLGLLDRSPHADAYPWAEEFDDRIITALEQGDDTTLVRYDWLGDAAQQSVPTPEHYLPLAYIAGARRSNDQIRILTRGIELGSISMTSFAFEAL